MNKKDLELNLSTALRYLKILTMDEGGISKDHLIHTTDKYAEALRKIISYRDCGDSCASDMKDIAYDVLEIPTKDRV